LLAVALGAARAADGAQPAPVALNLVSQNARSAEDYLAGTTFALTVAGPLGPISESGDVLAVPSFMLPYGPPGPRQPDLRDLTARISLSPDLNLDLGYQLDDAGRFTLLAPSTSGYDGLFLSGGGVALSPTPYGTSSYAGASVKLSDDVRLHLGDAMATRDRNADSGNAFASFGRPVDALLNLGARTANSLFGGVSLDGGWASIDLTASRTVAKQAFLGDAALPELSTMLDVTANVKFDGGWVTTASYGEGLSKLDVKPSALGLSSAGELHRTGYALAVAKHGVFGDDALGLSVSRPADPDGGYATFGGHLSQPAFIGADHLLMIDQKPETDIEVGYVTNFLDGAVALQTNAAYDMNFQGANGTNAVQLLSRAKFKF
jgi:hypothetical protein